MALIVPNKIGIREQRKQEDMAAENAKLQSDIDYIAMMADIDLEEGDDETTDDEEEEE